MKSLDFPRSERGGVSVLTAVSSVALLGFAGFATDLGAVYLESRRLQGTADLAALAAMQNPAQAEMLARSTVRDNGWAASSRVAITRGFYEADRRLPPARRFRVGAAAPNAVRVEVATTTPLSFGRLVLPSGRMTITRRATAAQRRAASFQIGSRLLSLRGGVANEVMSGLTGSSVNLSVMDYNALLSAEVELLSYVEALRARLDVEAASFNRTLAHHAEAPDALGALGDVLAAQDERAERAVRRLAESAERANRGVELDQIIDLGPYGEQDNAAASGSTGIRVNAMDLASAILQIAGGDRQVRLQLGAEVPGLAETEAWLAIGERPHNSPWLPVTDDEDVVLRTAQMRLSIEARIGAGAVSVRIPVLTETASAAARLEEIECSADGRRSRVTLAVSPSVGALMLGDVDLDRLDNFRSPLRPRPAQLVRAGLARVEGEAEVNIGGDQWIPVRFSGADIERNAVKSVATRDAAQATMSSLLGRTRLTIRAGGLGLSAGALTSSVQAALSAAARPLDDLANGLSDLLGVRLGEADVRVNGVRCGGAALVA